MSDVRTLIVLSCAVTVGVVGLWQNARTHEAIIRLSEMKEESMSTLTATWTSGGIPHTLTTTRSEGESAEDFARRHLEELNAALLKLNEMYK